MSNCNSMNKTNKINYVEFPAKELEATKQFFETAFEWSFQDFGTDYIAFSNQGIDGGFYRSDLSCSVANGGALVVLFSDNLQSTLQEVERAGGIIVKPIFEFPGGRRFHFTEPSGNELAVWSDADA